MNLSQAAQILDAQHLGNDLTFEQISIDTRTLQPGDLFIAITGKNYDGHQFIPHAEQQHAAAVVVSAPTITTLPTLVVADTTQALGQLAAYHRDQFNIPLIGVTGSCGKTTTKSLIANILRQQGETLCNQRSFNNQFGVPLTLLELNSNHHYAVIEMGTNHFGDISYLTNIAKPTIALITNAAAAHLEGLHTVEGVAHAKGEIFAGLSTDGIAVINADDQFAKFWSTLAAPRPIITFSATQPADVYAKNIDCTEPNLTRFTLVTPLAEIAIELSLLGQHNVANATAAAAVAYALSIPLTAIQHGIKTSSAVDSRLKQYSGYQGAHIIDDSYNANPLSFKAAIHTLASQTGKKILVVGDMRELAEHAKDYHRQLGLEAKTLGIEAIYAYGELSKYTAEAFGENAQHFLDQQQLIATLKPSLNRHITVLIKGSFSMNMKRIVEALCHDE